MANCSYCGSMILFGGAQEGARRFCNETCRQRGVLLQVAGQIPPHIVDEAIRETHEGDCPKCGGRGPVDVHTSYKVWSAFVLTSWSSQPQVCCSRCGWKAKAGDALFSFLLGWWGIPWGLILTPVQVSRNLYGLVKGSGSGRPSDELRKMVSIQLASAALAAPPRPQTPPPLHG